MFDAKLGSAAQMRKVIDSVKDLLTEACFDCTDNSIALQAMDSSHVALVSLKLDANGFEHYRCDRTFNLGINLAHLSKVLKCCGNDDSITLSHQEDSDLVVIKFQNTNETETSEYELKLMDLDTEHLGIPETEYSCVVSMPSAKFQRICRDLAMMGDSLTITATKAGVEFAAKGDMGAGKIQLTQTTEDDAKDAVTIELTDPVNITFAVKYLNQFTKASPLSPTVTLSMSSGVPIVVEYPIDGLEDSQIRYYLAPKIDEDENND